MPDRRHDGGSKLSPSTLVVASLSSLTAAIVTSTFWRGGTPITAAITPVIVAIASELYSRPAQRITELGSRAARTRTRASSENGMAPERVTVPPSPRRLPAEPGPGPVRVYRSESVARSRRLRLKAAIVTAALAFAIAVVVLTVPELVFGGSVASHGETTFFGGHASKHRPSSKPTQAAPTTSTPAPTVTAPQQTTTTPTAPPAQTVPQTTTPAPPAAGGSPAQQTPTTPAQTP